MAAGLCAKVGPNLPRGPNRADLTREPLQVVNHFHGNREITTKAGCLRPEESLCHGLRLRDRMEKLWNLDSGLGFRDPEAGFRLRGIYGKIFWTSDGCVPDSNTSNP